MSAPASAVPARKLGCFLHLSLDGCFCDAQGDMGFAHKEPGDAEWNEFVAGNIAPGFAGPRARLDLALEKSRVFGNGSVVLWYAPRRRRDESPGAAVS